MTNFAEIEGAARALVLLSLWYNDHKVSRLMIASSAPFTESKGVAFIKILKVLLRFTFGDASDLLV